MDKYKTVCIGKCAEFENDDCCLTNCALKESGVYVDGTINASKLEETYMDFVLRENYTLEWKETIAKVIAESVSECNIFFF